MSPLPLCACSLSPGVLRDAHERHDFEMEKGGRPPFRPLTAALVGHCCVLRARA